MTTDTYILAIPARSSETLVGVDLGCGIGASTILAAAPGSDQIWFAIDSNGESLSLAGRSFRDFTGADGPRLVPVCARLEALPFRELPGGFADTVIANPPYRALGTGRRPRSDWRAGFGHGDELTLAVFARAASRLLVEGGSYHFIVPPDRLISALLAVRAFGLHPRTLQPVGQAGEPSRLVRFHCLYGVERSLELRSQVSAEELVPELLSEVH